MHDRWWKLRIALVCQPAAIFASYAIAWAKNFGSAPVALKLGIGIGMGALMSALLIRLIERQARDYELARSGDLVAIRARLEGRFPDPRSLFWLLYAVGANDAAERVMRERLRAPLLHRGPLPAFAEALALARNGVGEAEAFIDRVAMCRDDLLAAWNPAVRASERLHASLVALAGTLTNSRAASERALEKLAAAMRDEEIAAYTAWLRAHLDAAIDPGETSEASERAAELAAKAGHAAVAKAARIRAARIRAARAGLAYR